MLSAAAVFGLPEVTLAVIPGFGGTQRLPRLVGYGKAKELIFTGEQIQSAEAHRLGLVNRVVASDALLPEALKLADLLRRAARWPSGWRSRQSVSRAATSRPASRSRPSFWGTALRRRKDRKGCGRSWKSVRRCSRGNSPDGQRRAACASRKFVVISPIDFLGDLQQAASPG
jgi:enoyl-CoA hydratase/carnithine racemase